MIANEREYQITQAAAKRFEEALAREDEREDDEHPLLKQAMRDSIASELEILRAQLVEYEAIRQNRIAVVETDSLARLPDVLIRARVAAGVSTGALAERLGIGEEQVRHYEETRYADASIGQAQAVADALGVRIRERAAIPVGPGGGRETPTGEPPEGRPGPAHGLSGALRRRGLSLHDLAARLMIPNGFALKLQRGRIDPATLPARFASRLGDELNLDETGVRQLVGMGAPRTRAAQYRAQGQPGTVAKPQVESFREALAGSPDLTVEQRLEWLGAEE